MSVYLGASYVWGLDCLAILATRKPSIDKELHIAFSPQVGWYQHRHGNIQITSKVFNRAKCDKFTPLACKLLEFTLFIHQTAWRVIGDRRAQNILNVIEEVLEDQHNIGNISFFNHINAKRSNTFNSDKVQEQGAQSLSGLPRELGHISVLKSYFPEGTSPSMNPDEEVNDEDDDAIIKDDNSAGNAFSKVRRNYKFSHRTVPPAARKTVCKLAKELEHRYNLSLPWHNGLPDPLNFGDEDGKEDVFQLTWNVTEACKSQQMRACNMARIYQRPKMPNLDDSLYHPKLQGLSAYSAANNTAVSFYIVLCQSYLDGSLLRCHGTGLRTNLKWQHPLNWSYGHAIHGWLMSHGFNTPKPKYLKDMNKMAQNFTFESRFFNWWRVGDRRLIAGLDVNKSFGVEFARKQSVDERLSSTFTEEEL